MAKAIAFMLVLYVGMAISVGILAGGGGISATELTVAVDEDDATLTVEDTSNFLEADKVHLESEEVTYTGTTDTTFTGCTRGYDGTTPSVHAIGTRVYTTGASVVNSALGFSVASTVDSMGTWSVIVIPFQFIFQTIPHLLMMPYTLFTGDLMIFAILLIVIQVAIVIVIAISLTGARRV